MLCGAGVASRQDLSQLSDPAEPASGATEAPPVPCDAKVAEGKAAELTEAAHVTTAATQAEAGSL